MHSLIFIMLLLIALVCFHSVDSKRVNEVVVEPLNVTATDCSEYTHSVQLANDVYMEYVLTNETVSVYVEFDVLAWVGFGICPDANGKMVGSDAIIGLPNEVISSTNPGKYTMNGETVSTVTLRNNNKQNLIDSSVWQDTTNGKTYLQFTKYLLEDNEHPIYADGQNFFLWAYGMDNDLGVHNEDTGCGAFLIQPGTMCIPQTNANPVAAAPATENDNDDEEQETDVDEADDETEEEDQENEQNDTDEDESSEDGNATTLSDPVTLSNGAVCTDYQASVSLDNNLGLYYLVNEDTVSIKMELIGEAWISFGIAPDSGGNMFGSDAVIGLPGLPIGLENPAEYHMNGKDVNSVNMIDSNLKNATIEQVNGITTLVFTKDLVSENKIPIVGNGENTFLWAYGYSNELAVHKAYGSFRLSLVPCSNMGNETSGTISLEANNKYSSDKRKKMWAAHGLMGVLAWGFLAPTAFTVSWLRNYLMSSFFGPGLWFKIHMYTNLLVLLLTACLFSISVILYIDDGDEHFKGTHQAVGLTVMLMVIIQAGLGIMRPHIPEKPETIMPNEHVTDSENGATQESNIDDTYLRKKKIRAGWEALHKSIGYFLIMLGLWQVHSGTDLYSENFGTKDYTKAFWSTLGGAFFVVLMLKVYSRVRDKQ